MYKATFFDKAQTRIIKEIEFSEIDVILSRKTVIGYFNKLETPIADICILTHTTEDYGRIHLAIGKMRYGGKGDPEGFSWD